MQRAVTINIKFQLPKDRAVAQLENNAYNGIKRIRTDVVKFSQNEDLLTQLGVFFLIAEGLRVDQAGNDIAVLEFQSDQLLAAAARPLRDEDPLCIFDLTVFFDEKILPFETLPQSRINH